MDSKEAFAMGMLSAHAVPPSTVMQSTKAETTANFLDTI
jgi:hypothetical protein